MFTSSATECWEIAGQSLIKAKSQHFYNGAFGEKWFNLVSLLGKKSIKTTFDINDQLPIDKLDLNCDLVCITQNETSNGTQLTLETLQQLKSMMKNNQLLAIDATSSMGGIVLDFELGDFWFASVQKCFGLPAGMAIIILSEKAIQRANEINEQNHYNSLLNIINNTRQNQTHYTPNILDIYLLFRTQQNSKGIDSIHSKLTKRFNLWSEFIDAIDYFDWLIDTPELRSETVLSLTCLQPDTVKQLALKNKFVLGNGYGSWKKSTIRLANFPAIKTKEIKQLIKFFEETFN